MNKKGYRALFKFDTDKIHDKKNAGARSIRVRLKGAYRVGGKIIKSNSSTRSRYVFQKKRKTLELTAFRP